MSNIRTQFLHKGIMLGVCLLGVLISTFFSANGSETAQEPLLVEHRIEQQTAEADHQMDMATANSDSLLIVEYRNTAAE
jgi:hypothetical protein